MTRFADNGLNAWDIAGLVAIFAVLVVVIVLLAVFVRFFRLWVQSATTGAGSGFLDMLGMTFRRVPPEVIVRSTIIAVPALEHQQPKEETAPERHANLPAAAGRRS
jgi:uncharacterized protein YqfA (UPF0365 family)